MVSSRNYSAKFWKTTWKVMSPEEELAVRTFI